MRLISDKGEQLGILTLDEALSFAEQADLDLVEVAPGAKPGRGPPQWWVELRRKRL